MIKTMPVLIISTLSIIIAGCGENLEDVIMPPTKDCECETPKGGFMTQCALEGQTKTIEWNKRDGKSCEESKPSGYICCSNTIEETSIESNFFDNFSNRTFSSKTVLVATTGDGFDLLADDTLKNSHNCLDACKDPTSTLCHTIKQGAATMQMKGINYLHDQIKSGASSIKKSKVMDLFNQANDPCDRSDLMINGGVLSNAGKSCSAITQIKLSATKLLDFTISMNETITGSIKQTGDVTSLVFDKRSESMNLTIGNKYLDKDFGGDIHSISKTSSQIIVETDKGCILF